MIDLQGRKITLSTITKEDFIEDPDTTTQVEDPRSEHDHQDQPSTEDEHVHTEKCMPPNCSN
jgi:hypothetical protein